MYCRPKNSQKSYSFGSLTFLQVSSLIFSRNLILFFTNWDQTFPLQYTGFLPNLQKLHFYFFKGPVQGKVRGSYIDSCPF